MKKIDVNQKLKSCVAVEPAVEMASGKFAYPVRDNKGIVVGFSSFFPQNDREFNRAIRSMADPEKPGLSPRNEEYWA